MFRFIHRNCFTVTSIAMLALLAQPAIACDLCSVYTAQLADGQGAEGWFVGIAEQYTRYDELRDEGRRIPDGGQYLKSSVTQLLVGYGVNAHWTMQANLPYIDRRFKRPDGDIFERGSETGIGDLTVTTQYLAYRHDDEDSTFTLRFLGGLKFGTGDSDRLREELDEEHHDEGDGHDEGIPSGIHGHDLALGSGSTDIIFGTSIFGRQGRWLYSGDAQYVLRSRGDIDYEYGDDLQWSLGFGRYLSLQHNSTVALQAVLSGEDKQFDNLAGERAADTKQQSVFLGPKLSATFGTRFSLDLRIDFPLDTDNSAIQITPGWRARAAFVAHF
ncbi:MAG: hypothetical protein CVV27_18815 [Candidatus Melainabacteria bacterium HGW-Melainabacteria-1]|nr:MAG: hypothetical protein CVV27_18815 [Candidatus Melainabacteria bacterium HGW-Melainabacteria-1]